MNREYEIEFYKGLAEEIKPQGFRCFLYDREMSAWLYIITPNNSWLYVDAEECGGYHISYQYKPSKKFGRGLSCNEQPLYEITAKTLFSAEQFGKQFGEWGYIEVPNVYDGGKHKEKVWLAPKHYKDAYEAMMSNWNAQCLIEL